MSIESLKRTSDIEDTKDISDDINKSLAPRKVKMDVLKRRIIQNRKKEKIKGRIIFLSFFLSLGLIGYLIN